MTNEPTSDARPNRRSRGLVMDLLTSIVAWWAAYYDLGCRCETCRSYQMFRLRERRATAASFPDGDPRRETADPS